MSHEDTLRLWNDGVLGGLVRPKARIINKTGNYTLVSKDFGSVFTTRGGSGSVFTLPAASSVNKGDWALFVNVANQNMSVSGPDEGVVTFNDLTADGVGLTTTNEKIGGMLLAISDGTSWIILPISTETQTVQVFTATSASPSASESSSPSTSPSAS